VGSSGSNGPRHLASRTGAHDVIEESSQAPQPSRPDTQLRPQRASSGGGGISDILSGIFRKGREAFTFGGALVRHNRCDVREDYEEGEVDTAQSRCPGLTVLRCRDWTVSTLRVICRSKAAYRRNFGPRALSSDSTDLQESGPMHEGEAIKAVRDTRQCRH